MGLGGKYLGNSSQPRRIDCGYGWKTSVNDIFRIKEPVFAEKMRKCWFKTYVFPY